MTTQRSLSITTFSNNIDNSPGTAIVVATFLNANQYKWIASHGSTQEVISDWATISNNWTHREGAIWDKALPVRTGRAYYLQVRAGETGAVTTSNPLGPFELNFKATEPKIRFTGENEYVTVNTDSRQGARTGGINLLEIDYRAIGSANWRTGQLRNTDTGWALLNKQWLIPSDARVEDTQFRARWGHEPRTSLNQRTQYGEYGSIEYYPEVPLPETTPITDVPIVSIAYNDPSGDQATVSWTSTSEPEAHIELEFMQPSRFSRTFTVATGSIVYSNPDGRRTLLDGVTVRARFFTYPKDGVPERDGPWSEVITVAWPDDVVPTAGIALTVGDYIAGSKVFHVGVTFANTEFAAMSVRLQQSDDGSTGWTWLGSVVGGLDSGSLTEITRTVGAGKYVRVRTILQNSPRLYVYSNVIGPFEAAGITGAPTQAPFLRINEPDEHGTVGIFSWVDRATHYDAEVNRNDVIGWFRLTTIDAESQKGSFLGQFIIRNSYLQNFNKFRIRGYNEDGSGPYSNVVEFVTGEGLEPFYEAGFSVACFIGERNFA